MKRPAAVVVETDDMAEVAEADIDEPATSPNRATLKRPASADVSVSSPAASPQKMRKRPARAADQ